MHHSSTCISFIGIHLFFIVGDLSAEAFFALVVLMTSPTQREEDEVQTNGEAFLIAVQEASPSEQEVAQMLLKIENFAKNEVEEATPQVEASFSKFLDTAARRNSQQLQ